MERSHITQSDAPRQEISTQKAIGACMCLILFALSQRPITNITNPLKSAEISQNSQNSTLHNSASLSQPSLDFPQNRTQADPNDINRPESQVLHQLAHNQQIIGVKTGSEFPDDPRQADTFLNSVSGRDQQDITATPDRPGFRPETAFPPQTGSSPAKGLNLLDGELRETTLGKPLSKSDRVLAYLAKAELSEPDAWMRDDIRVAWLTVLRCAQNVPDPWRYSFWTYYGTVPEKAIPYWQQRTADREWMLGRVAAYEKSKKQNRPAIVMPKKEGVA